MAGISMPGRNSLHAYFFSIRNCLLCFGLLILGGFGLPLFGQNGIDTMDVGNYPYAAKFLGMSGDTMKFQFDLGSMEEPVENVLGYDLSFGFPKLLVSPNATLVEVEGTWLTDGLSSPQAQWAFDGHVNSMELSFFRPDTAGQTGYGKVAAIFLIRSGGFEPVEASIFLDGGEVMVDNIDLRRSNYLQPDLRVFPNPAKDYIEVWTGIEDGLISISDLEGRLLLVQPARSWQRIALATLPRGSYLLGLETEIGTQQKVIVLQ
jgi:hypothetical protein